MTLGAEFTRVIEGAQRGDQDCLGSLYRDVNPRVLHYLRMRAFDQSEDLASETWLSVARSIGTFSGDEEGFRKWIFTIARNHVIAHHRKAGRQKTEALDNASLDLLPSGTNVATMVTDKIAARELISRLVDRLPADQAEVVRLKVVAGFSTEEIAEVIGKKTGNVRVLLHRALRKLAAEMPTAEEMPRSGA